jgi:hypothetical protein
MRGFPDTLRAASGARGGVASGWQRPLTFAVSETHMVDLDKRAHAQHDVGFDTTSRYDVLITAPNPTSYKLSAGAAKALILNLKTKYWIRPVEEAVTDDWVEVYCLPEPISHEIFTPGTFRSDQAVFLEAAIYFGQQAVEPGYGPKMACFYIEFRGCVFKEPLGAFRKLIKDILNIRPEVAWRPHVSLPPHREVPVEESDVYDQKP